MKLLSLTNRYYFFSIIFIVILASFGSYEIIKSVINTQFNKKLFAEKEQLINELRSYEDLRDSYYLNIGDIITIRPMENSGNIPVSLSDTLIYDDFQKTELTYRKITFNTLVDQQNYKVVISKSLLSTQEMIKAIGEIMLVLMAALILCLILVNRLISGRIWRPFYEIMNFLRKYDITTPKNMDTIYTNVEEFSQLKSVINSMVTKTRNDYLVLKEFGENASHEIQTPLAIIKAKCELLMQEKNLNEEQLNDINAINNSVSRLSKLNEDLLLLTRIDNRQFSEGKKIELIPFLENQLKYYEEILEFKSIHLNTKFTGNPVLFMNETLVYVLITNLLNNAIKYNDKNGSIEIEMNDQFLMIRNSGKPLEGDPEKYFDRFRRGVKTGSSSGLGLSLVKKICTTHNMQVFYDYQYALHTLTVYLKNHKPG